MAEQAPTYEMVEVKAEDIMAERQALYAGFMGATKWAIGVTAALLALMAIFLV
ncbi:aa3-type cytochrome c oxidase subunit IV [Falsiroseomonas selenitidurans]|uniref:Aa3-type cytochrome c oxidase subunit IV n=1 Tax=Falsiroseomonas selenitidurans TaxID=2716335 RepID=A0ABX1E3P0_9PROT|nr:aa3-type cytochrome c oxidase subunit IV [Falsiroseomonas selenitidurans]NKC31804.1 aa3-type cytochrome c oxidase subunit IV [Falsiroseomonas selenitidurans]